MIFMPWYVRTTFPPDADDRPGEKYRTPVVDLGGCLIANLDDIAGALAVAEGEEHS